MKILQNYCHNRYYCITWTKMKGFEAKLDRNNTRMHHDVFNRSWRQHITKYQLCDHLPPILVRSARYGGHCQRSKGELIGNVLLWTRTYEFISVGWSTKIYICQLCMDTGCRQEDLPRVTDDRDIGERKGQGNLCCLCTLMMMIFSL